MNALLQKRFVHRGAHPRRRRREQSPDSDKGPAFLTSDLRRRPPVRACAR